MSQKRIKQNTQKRVAAQKPARTPGKTPGWVATDSARAQSAKDAKKKKAKRKGSFFGNLFERDKPLNICLVLFIDALIIGAALCVFALFDHVLPQNYGTPEEAAEAVSPFLSGRGSSQTSVQTRVTPTPVPFVTDSDAQTTVTIQTSSDPDEAPKPEEIAQDELQDEPVIEGPGYFSFPGKFTNGEVIVTADSYQSQNVYVTVKKHTSSGKYNQRYFVVHVYIRDIMCLQSVFAQDTYGKGITEDFQSMAQRSNSIAAINTDFYNFARHPKSMLIRNGLLYGSEPSDEYDLCVINFDGTMDVYKKGKSPDGNTLLANGAFHTFCFGPILLQDGKKMPSYEDVSRDPRTAIGMVEPGHYVFLVCDGRRQSAMGYTYKGLADILLGEGCVVGYNLDGGDSSQLAFMGEITNMPSRDGRAVSDIFIVAEP